MNWPTTKRKWFKLNPANHQGYHICAFCQRWVINPDLDHLKTRGSRPDLKYELSNLRPVCRSCHIKRHNGTLMAEES